MPIIDVRHLTKVYYQSPKTQGFRGAVRAIFAPQRKAVRAVDDISFSIEPGEIVGYVGPNGAGKSTTLKILSGILHPTAGSVLIDGLSPQRQRKAVVRNLGVVFGQRSQLYWDLRLGESFELLRRIYQVPAKTFAAHLDWLSGVLGLADLVDVPVRQLSLGQRMRGELAAAMLHMPAILFLDEPTIGLDLDAKNAVRRFVLDLNRDRKTTVILTTHDLMDVERLCCRLMVINHGKVIEDGPLDALIDRLAPYRVLVIDCEAPDVQIDHPALELIRRDGARLWLRFDRTRFTAARIIADLLDRIAIRDLSVKEPNIEDVIARIYEAENRSRSSPP